MLHVPQLNIIVAYANRLRFNVYKDNIFICILSKKTGRSVNRRNMVQWNTPISDLQRLSLLQDLLTQRSFSSVRTLYLCKEKSCRQ